MQIQKFEKTKKTQPPVNTLLYFMDVYKHQYKTYDKCSVIINSFIPVGIALKRLHKLALLLSTYSL